jgi:hypothetical protein
MNSPRCNAAQKNCTRLLIMWLANLTINGVIPTRCGRCWNTGIFRDGWDLCVHGSIGGRAAPCRG